jgi:hypothetical protein
MWVITRIILIWFHADIEVIHSCSRQPMAVAFCHFTGVSDCSYQSSLHGYFRFVYEHWYQPVSMSEPLPSYGALSLTAVISK